MATLFSSLLGGSSKSTGARLLERLGSATQLEDRRDAIASFKELTAREPVRLIEKGGISVIVRLVQDADQQLVRDALEALVNMTDAEVPKDAGDAARVAAAHNSSVLLSNSANLPIALSAMEDPDMYTRFYSVQLLVRLVLAAPKQTEAAMLEQPAALGRVMKLGEDKSEVVRNEVLLLLLQLSKASQPVKNILAFQGAYELLLAVIESEVAAGDGGSAVVGDCFSIIGELLAASTANRSFFEESGCLERLVPLLRLPAAHRKADTKRVSFVCALLWRLLCASKSASSSEGERTRDTLHRLDVLAALASMPTDPTTVTETALRVQALCTITQLVQGHVGMCTALVATQTSRKTDDGTVSEALLPRILSVALRSPPLYQAAAAELFSVVFRGQPDMQLSHAAFLSPMQTDAPASPAKGSAISSLAPLGKLATDALFSAATTGSSTSSATQAWLASSVLCAVLHGNADAKVLLLRAPAGESAGMMARCTDVLHEALQPDSQPLVALSVLRLLLVWLWESKEAVDAFCSRTPSLPALVDVLTEPPTDSHVAGHAAALLGTCLLLTPEEDVVDGGGSNASAVLPRARLLAQMIARRIGLRKYENSWDRLRNSGPFTSAAAQGGASPLDASCGDAALNAAGCVHGAVVYDADSIAMLQGSYEKVRAKLLEEYSLPPHESPMISSAAALSGEVIDTAVGATPEHAGDGEAVTAAHPAADPMVAPPQLIESFKQVIRSQDEAARSMQAELGETKAKLAASVAQLRVQTRTSLSALQARLLTSEMAAVELALQEVIDRAGASTEAAVADTSEQLRELREEHSAVVEELEALAASHAQLEGLLERRERELAAAQAAAQDGKERGNLSIEGHGSSGVEAGKGTSLAAPEEAASGAADVSQSVQLRLAMQQGLVEGLERDKLALQRELQTANEAARKAEEAIAQERERATQAEEALATARAEYEVARAEGEAARRDASEAASRAASVEGIHREGQALISRLKQQLADAEIDRANEAEKRAKQDALAEERFRSMQAATDALGEEHEELLICLAEQDALTQELSRRLAGGSVAPAKTPATGFASLAQ